ncbi:hypothetical protein ACHNHT_001109 [Salmonella enterica]
MFYVDNNSGSPTMPALSPAQSNTPTWFTEGDRNKGISHIGQDWLNILQAELLNILSEAGIKPDKGKLNQLTLSIKAIITANAYTQANNLKEIFDAGIAAQAAARSHLGLGKLATKDSLGPTDVSALAKDQNLNDVPDKAKARQSLQLGNSATRNVGASANTVAAGDDIRITASKKAIDDTQIGLAAQSVMWITSADDLSNLPSGARRFAANKAPAAVLPATGYFFLEVLAKRDTANGSCILATSGAGDVWIGLRYTVPGEAAFTWTQLNQNVQNLGLAETLNPTKRVSIGNIGTGAFDGSTPCINIGDSDSGFIGSADGVLDIYCNNAKVGYIDNAGLHMLAGIATNGNVVLQNDARTHLIIQNSDGSARAYIFKAKGDDGIHINNGADGGGDFILRKDGGLTLGSGAQIAPNGDILGGVWGSGWLSTAIAIRDNNINGRATIDWVNQNFITRVKRGEPVNPGKVNEYGPAEAPAGCVVTSVRHDPTTAYGIYFTYRPLSIFINGGWRVIEG